MTINAYIRYFFYLAYNWNLAIAFHIIRNEIRGEKKYGIQSTGADELTALEKKGIDITHATIYMPASYDLLEKVFEAVKISGFNHFVDIGCGKGRAMCVAAYAGVRKVSGIDFSKALCDAAIKNLSGFNNKMQHLEFHVINNDAFYFEIPTDADCIFLFNPFDELIMSGVVNNISRSLAKKPRRLCIIYLNPLYKQLFSAAGFKETYHFKKKHYLEVVVLEN